MLQHTEKIKIFVATHCQQLDTQGAYTPIHVGHALHTSNAQFHGMLTDNTGDNISDRNRSYCELTAAYWVWKNHAPTEYVGLAHYRRYFETVLTPDNIDTIMSDCDVLLPEPYLHDRCMEFKLARHLTMEDEAIFLTILKRLHPEIEQTAIDYLYDFKDYPYNMFVMRWEQFTRYCEFLFPVLDACYQTMLQLPYTASTRRIGYIAEMLLPIYCLHHHLRIKKQGIVDYIVKKAIHSSYFKQRIKIRILKQIYDKHKPSTFEQMIMPSVTKGLAVDNIYIQSNKK